MARKTKATEKQQPKPKAAETERPDAEQDVEGHLFLPDVQLARVMALEREREIRRRLETRARETEARHLRPKSR